MEIIQTMWNAITTQNDTALTICFFLLSFVEASVSVLLFTTVLNIVTTKKNKLLYVLLVAIVGSLCRLFLPDPWGIFLNIIFIIFSVKFIFKTSCLKALLAEFIMISSSSILELFVFKFYQHVFNILQEQILEIPLYRIITALSIYFCIYLIYLKFKTKFQ